MRNLMLDLLDFAQIEKSTFKISSNYFNIFNVIENSIKIVEHIAEKKKVRIIPPVITLT